VTSGQAGLWARDQVFAATKKYQGRTLDIIKKAADFRARILFERLREFSSALMEIPGLTLLHSSASSISVEDIRRNYSLEAGDTSHTTKSFSAQADVITDLPTMDATASVQLPFEVINLSIPSKRLLEKCQDSEGSKRQKTAESARPELNVGPSFSVPLETQRNHDPQTPEEPPSELLPTKNAKSEIEYFESKHSK